MRAAAVALLFLLAGCSGAGSDDGDGPGGVKHKQGTENEEDKAKGIGRLHGRVHDDVDFSIEAARVDLLGTSAFAVTDADGRFRLAAPAGSYTLRVAAPGFRALEEPIEVVAGLERELDITLYLVQNRTGGYQAHVHDFWGGATEYVLLDGVQDLMENRGPDGTVPGNYEGRSIAAANQGTRDHFEVHLPAWEPGHPTMVIPGTGAISVTLEWDEMPVERMGLSYYSADSTELTVLASATSGDTVRFDVTPAMWDSGHQLWTQWRFYVYMDQSAAQPTQWQPTVPGDVHVKIVLHKAPGPVPLEIGHEDFWQDATTMVLKDDSKIHTPIGACCRLKASFTQGGDLPLDDGVLVPPGTKTIRLHFEWWYDLASGVGDKEYRLVWRTGEQDPHTTSLADLKSAAVVEEGDGFKVYEFDLDPAETDKWYQKRTNWLFVPLPVGEDAVPYHLEKNPPRMTLQVQVWKDPEFR